MTDIETPALEPCPFCGTKPHTAKVAGGRIVVTDCPRECPMTRHYVQVAAWNARASGDKLPTPFCEDDPR